jgi:hypothetical protein
MADQPDNDTPPKWVSNAQLQLELRAMGERFERRIGDDKLWMLGAVALNQFLAAVDLPSTVAGIGVASLGIAAKLVAGVIARG